MCSKLAGARVLKFKIGGLKKSSLLDYPGKISAIVFTHGCNFRCGYCHNPGLISLSEVSCPPAYTPNAFFDFLKRRTGKLDGVVITGGEPCLQPDLESFIKEIRKLGFLVKLDTNGYMPNVLSGLLDNNLLDYAAMDIKGPLEKYEEIVGVSVNISNIQKSISLLLDCNIEYEFRTTVLKSQLNIEDFKVISELIKGAKRYYLQKFEPNDIFNPALNAEKNYSKAEYSDILPVLEKNIKLVEVRYF